MVPRPLAVLPPAKDPVDVAEKFKKLGISAAIALPNSTNTATARIGATGVVTPVGRTWLCSAVKWAVTSVEDSWPV